MSKSQCYKLKIDTGFKNLIPPLSIEEYLQLEQNLIKEGCREPICIWNGYIIDGHNRYEICTNRNIPFQIYSVELKSREEAVSWICANQLGRRNISHETRKYLIGKRYEAEKIAGTPNAVGSNQYVKVDGPKKWNHPLVDGIKYKTAMRLGNEYHISHGTVFKYGIFAQALDKLAINEPEIVTKILSGQVKMSHESTVEVSQMPSADIKKLCEQLSDDMVNHVGYSEARRKMQRSIMLERNDSMQFASIKLPTGSIKDMPAYDPDAQISSLSLTIPSWVSSIERARSTADICNVSTTARVKLEIQLNELKEIIEVMLAAIKGEINNG